VLATAFEREIKEEGGSRRHLHGEEVSKKKEGRGPRYGEG